MNHESLFEHLALGRHTSDSASDTKLDTISRKWAVKVSEVATTSRQPTIGESELSSITDPSTPVAAGWAVKMKKQSKRFALAVKNFLYDEAGEENSWRRNRQLFS